MSAAVITRSRAPWGEVWHIPVRGPMTQAHTRSPVFLLPSQDTSLYLLLIPLLTTGELNVGNESQTQPCSAAGKAFRWPPSRIGCPRALPHVRLRTRACPTIHLFDTTHHLFNACSCGSGNRGSKQAAQCHTWRQGVQWGEPGLWGHAEPGPQLCHALTLWLGRVLSLP